MALPLLLQTKKKDTPFFPYQATLFQFTTNYCIHKKCNRMIFVEILKNTGLLESLLLVVHLILRALKVKIVK